MLRLMPVCRPASTSPTTASRSPSVEPIPYDARALMMPHVFRSLEEARGRLRLCALTIGNFDGVHIGHRALVAATLRYAVANALTPAVLTFYPHPTVIVAPERVPQLICTLDQRLRFLQAAGATNIIVLPVTADFEHPSPRQF